MSTLSTNLLEYKLNTYNYFLWGHFPLGALYTLPPSHNFSLAHLLYSNHSTSHTLSTNLPRDICILLYVLDTQANICLLTCHAVNLRCLCCLLCVCAVCLVSCLSRLCCLVRLASCLVRLRCASCLSVCASF